MRQILCLALPILSRSLSLSLLGQSHVRPCFVEIACWPLYCVFALPGSIVAARHGPVRGELVHDSSNGLRIISKNARMLGRYKSLCSVDCGKDKASSTYPK